jgi:hypothetical protein
MAALSNVQSKRHSPEGPDAFSKRQKAPLPTATFLDLNKDTLRSIAILAGVIRAEAALRSTCRTFRRELSSRNTTLLSLKADNTSARLVQQVEGYPNVESLSLGKSSTVTEVELLALAFSSGNGNRALKSLEVYKSSAMTDQAARTFARRCPQMECFKTNSSLLSAATFLSLPKGWKGLKCLHVGFIEDLTDEIVHRFAKSCPQLEELSLEGYITDVDSGHPLLTDGSLIALGRNCPQLESLVVNNAGSDTPFTEEGFVAIANGCSKLKHFEVGCHMVFTDDSLIALAEKCPQLEFLDLQDNSLTDEGLLEAAKHRPNFKHLFLEQGPNWTENNLSLTVGLTAIVEHSSKLCNLNVPEGSPDLVRTLSQDCPKLERLHFWRGCDFLTDAHLIELAKKCPLLTELVLGGCEHVTIASIEEVITRCPNIRLIQVGCLAEEDLTLLKTRFPHIQFR